MSDFITELEATLQSARKRVKQGNEVKQLKANAPLLFEIIDGEISLSINRMTQDKPLSYEDYLSEHGKVTGVRRIRNLLDSKEVEAPAAAEQAAAIQDSIKSLKTNG